MPSFPFSLRPRPSGTTARVQACWKKPGRRRCQRQPTGDSAVLAQRRSVSRLTWSAAATVPTSADSPSARHADDYDCGRRSCLRNLSGAGAFRLWWGGSVIEPATGMSIRTDKGPQSVNTK
ncbi:uncharacterized protein LOC125036857 isoform X1 [Penaeus chinensis]|uniref:uncharacterized protein LOC125036857 isoform X1 n=1 Tax=Penaeus chinensis TaxID=139456 RepID=UPI001FB70781|nr:uncharacterized protein LOC125036857 isoform X1 [Penaeus chinensis]